MIRMLPARNAPWGLAVLLVALALGLVTAGGPSARAQEADSELRTLDLVQGFNLVGWAVDQPADEALAEAGAITDLFQFDAVSKRFATFGPGTPDFLNSLPTLIGGRGAWVLTTAATPWTVPDLPAAEGLTIDLEAGFNLVAWFGPDGIPIPEALAGLGDGVRRAFGRYAPGQRFTTYDPARAFLSDFESLSRGQGFWLDMAAAVSWQQPAAAQSVASADGRLTVDIPVGSGIRPSDVQIVRLTAAELGDAFAEFDVVAAYGLRVTADVPIDLPVSFSEGVLGVAQNGDPSDDASPMTAVDAEGNIILSTDAMGAPAPIQDQGFTVVTQGAAGTAAIHGTLDLTPGIVTAPGTPAPGPVIDPPAGEDEFTPIDPEVGEFDARPIIILDRNSLFRILQRFPEDGELFEIGGFPDLGLIVENLSGEDLSGVQIATSTFTGSAVTVFSMAQTKDHIQATSFWSPQAIHFGACTTTGAAQSSWTVTGTAPLGPDARFPGFTRSFSIEQSYAVECVEPAVTFMNVYTGFDLDTHLYTVDVPESGLDGPARDDYTVEWLVRGPFPDSEPGCGTAVAGPDQWNAGYLHKGCLDVNVERSTVVEVTLSLVIEDVGVTCTFHYVQPAFDNVGKGPVTLNGVGGFWDCQQTDVPADDPEGIVDDDTGGTE